MKRHLGYFFAGFLATALLVWSFLSFAVEKDHPVAAIVDSAIAQGSNQIDAVNAEIYSGRQTAITKAVANTELAVVSINVMAYEKIVQRSPFQREDPFWRYMFPELFRDRIVEQEVKSIGSGFIISTDGFVLSNAHVIQNAREIIVTMTDGESYKAKIVGVDGISDVALLKIEGRTFPFIEMGNSESIIIGEWVIAMGNPFGLFAINNKPTVTVGVVSARDRDFGYLEEANKVYQDMIQTDAAINSGNSGGPLINALGQAIGMNTFIYTGNNRNQGFVGIGFAIPINRIKQIIKQLQKEGQVNRQFYTGIEYRAISAYWAERLGLGNQPMIVITFVEPKSLAAKAGARVGDIIVEVNGKHIAIEKEIIAAIYEADLKVGDQMVLAIMRENKKLEIKFELIALEQ